MASTDTTTGPADVAKLGFGLLLVIGLVRTALLGVTDGITALGFLLAGNPRPLTLAAAGSKLWLVAVDVVTVVMVARLLTREGRTIRELWDPRPVGKTLLYAVAGFFIVYIALGIGGFVGNFLIYYGAPTATDTVLAPVWVGVVRAVIAPVTVAVAEETLFRGYLLPRLQLHLGKVGAVIVSALLAASLSFALNVGNLDAMLAGVLKSFIIGLAFGGLYLWQKRIAPLILVHWVFEAVVGVLVLVTALH